MNAIDAPGTREDTWRAWPGLAQLSPGRLGSPASVVVLAAHPDDEVLGAGGLLSLLASVGIRIRLVAVTDGEASHRGQADPGDLIMRRCNERAAALRELGASAAEVVRLVAHPAQVVQSESSAMDERVTPSATISSLMPRASRQLPHEPICAPLLASERIIDAIL